MFNIMGAGSTYPNSIGIHRLGASSSAKLRLATKLFFAVLFAVFLVGAVEPVLGQEELEIPRGVYLEEDPEALLSLDVGDADVDLFVLGSWRSGIRGSYGIAVHPPLGPEGSTVTPAYPFPGFETIPFYNIVDLTLSLWLYERFYFESTFADEFELRSILFGYQGRPGEFVQEVKVGNAPLSISEYPYIDIGEGIENTPGASALFETPRSSHEALLRYESSDSERMTFIGMNELREERIEPGSYIRGRFFVLPDGDVEELRLYIEDADGSVVAGDGRRYRQANLDAEAVVSRSDGTVQLRDAAAGQVVVSYTKSGLPVGDAGLGQGALVGALVTNEYALLDPDVSSDFSFSPGGTYYGLSLDSLETTVDGRQSLVLYRPGAFNPFEVQRYYETETDAAADNDLLFVRRGGSREVSFAPVRAARLDPESEAVEVIAPDEPGMNPRAAAFRYPFLGTEPEAPRLYGPRPQRTPGSTDFEILVRGLRPVSVLSLGSDIVPGTVRVERNGATDNSFTVDYRTGRLETPLPINPSDVIEVSFRSYSGGGLGGDLLFAFGNRFSVTDNLDAALALGLRWHVLGAPYSTEANQHPGAVTLSGELDYRGTNLDLLLDGAVSLQVPDTTGYLRLLGMEGNEQRLGVRDHTVVPAAPPISSAAGEYIDPAEGTGVLSGGTGLLDYGLSHTNRGRLIYRDFRQSDGLGTPQLQDYTWSPPSSQTYTYEDGGRIGPYTALARSDNKDGQVMVMEFEIDPSEPNTPLWVGAQMRPPNFADLDLSQVGRVEIEWYVPDNLGGDVEVYLQLGGLEEDIDGDGSLDRGNSRLQPQFPFRDAGRGIELLAGDGIPGAVFVNSEDGNRNSVLDAEAPGQIVTRRLASSNSELPTAGWRRDSFYLGPTERAGLSQMRGVRIIVVRDTATAAEGRLLVSELRFLGGSIPIELVDANGDAAADPPAPGDVRAFETLDPRTGSEALHRVFPDVRNVFHSEGMDAQRVLRVDWDGVPSGESVLLQQPVPATPWDHYRSLRFYLLVDSAELTADPDATIEIELLDPAGGGVRASLPLSELTLDSWNEVTLDILRKRLEVNGNNVAPLALERGRRSERLSLFRLQIQGAEAGRLYLDEIHWAEAQSSIEGAASAALEYRIPGMLLERGGFPILGNVVLNEAISVQSAGYGLESERVAGAGIFQSRSGAAADVVGTRLETDLELYTDQERWSSSGGHRLQIPARDSPVRFTDGYRRSYDSFAPAMSRGNSLRLRRAGLGSILLESEAVLVTERMDQVWGVTDNTSEEMVSWIADGNLRLRNRTTGYELPDIDYFSSWVDAYELLLPRSDREAARRSGDIRRRFGYRPDPLGFDIVLEGGYENSSVFDARQRNTVLLRGGPRFRFETAQRTQYAISPYYGRTASGSYAAPDNREFADDFAVYGDSLGEIPYFYSSIPIYELLQDRATFRFAEQTEGLPFARYRPETGLQFERSFGSRLRDLYIPSTAAFTIDRELLRRDDSLTDTHGMNVSLETVALNLFGSLGAYPLTQLYESDELSSGVEYSLRHREPDSTTLQQIRLENTTRFFASGDRTLALDSLVLFEIEEYFSREVAARVRYEWRIYPNSLFGIRRLDPVLERGAFIRNTERVTLAERRNDRRPERDLLTIVLGHESKLEIPDRGAVRVYLDFGVGREPFEVQDGDVVNQTLLGVQGGIEAVIEY